MHSFLVDMYEKYYIRILIIPIIILLASFVIVGNHYVQTGEFVSKGVSLKGGTTLTFSHSTASTEELSQHLISQYPTIDISVRALTRTGDQAGIIVEASDISADELLAAVELKTGKLDPATFTLDTTGPSLGESFFKQALIAVLAAFVLMSIVVYAYFREPLPSFYAIFSVFADALFSLAVFNLFGLKLTTAGVAAFLMLIGYSIDTDILLTTRVLKRSEGSVAERIVTALPTGLTMAIGALVSVIIAYYGTHSELLKQISFILGWGLVADIIFTWLFNATLLQIYMKKKVHHGN